MNNKFNYITMKWNKQKQTNMSNITNMTNKQKKLNRDL